MSDNMRNAEKEIVKIRRYVRRVWHRSSDDYLEEIVECLLRAEYTTLDAVKEIKSDDHLMLYGGTLPARFQKPSIPLNRACRRKMKTHKLESRDFDHVRSNRRRRGTLSSRVHILKGCSLWCL